MAGNRVISAVLTLKDKDFGTTAQKSATAMKDLERETKHSSNTVKNFGKSATSNFKKVALGAASIVTVIGATKLLSGAFNMVRGSIGSAFDRIDTMESFERTMTTLTGSAESAAQALEVTREAVTGTAYGLDVAAKGVQDFVTRGMEVEKATGVVEAFGDAVAFYGDGSNEQLASVSDALAKMYSKGKVDMQQMNRLFDAGIDAVGMYAKATNRDIGSVQSDLSSGAVSAEEFLEVVTDAMMEGTGGVEKIAGAAKEAGASWGASFDNMKAAVARGVTNIIQSIDDMLTSNGLPDMRSMVASFGKKFEDVLNSASDKIPIVTDYLVGVYERAQPGIDWMKDTAFPAIQDGIGFATDKAKDMYNFFVENWPIIGPIIAGVAATVTAFKLGIMAITTAKTIWAAVTSGVQIATMILNGTLAISPLGWVALSIGAVVAAGIALWQNWDTVKSAAQSLWDKMTAVGDGIKSGWESAWNLVKSSAESAINGVIDNINKMIGVINKIPGVNVPIVAQVEWSDATPPSGSSVVSASYAVGTNRVPHDMVAQIHKDEMIIPATQSRNLRKQGVTIDNIDKGNLNKTRSNTNPSGNGSISELINLIKTLIKRDGKSITVAKLADSIVVREESDIDKITTMLVRKLEDVNINML